MKNLKHILFLLLASVLLSACASKPVAEPASDAMMPNDEAVMDSGTGSDMKDTEGIATFNLTGENFKFIMDGTEAPDLRVKLGDTVRINLTSTDGTHDWVVDDFGAKTERVDTGESASVEFVANEAGTFEYYCSVGQHRANGMRGNLIVE